MVGRSQCNIVPNDSLFPLRYVPPFHGSWLDQSDHPYHQNSRSYTQFVVPVEEHITRHTFGRPFAQNAKDLFENGISLIYDICDLFLQEYISGGFPFPSIL